MEYAEAKAHATILLLGAQADRTENAATDLIEHIRIHLMPRRISRYLSKNRLVGNDDLKQEFMIGVALSIYKAKIDVGDPIEYLLSQGIYAVRRYMRKQVLGGTIQICSDCGFKGRLNHISRHTYQCKACGSINVQTLERTYHEDDTKIQAIPDSGTPDVDNDMICREILSTFEKTLTPGTNVAKVYYMLKSGIRDDMDEPNYICNIARQLGGCSENNVVEIMRKLRSRLSKIIETYEEGCEWYRRSAANGR